MKKPKNFTCGVRDAFRIAASYGYTVEIFSVFDKACVLLSSPFFRTPYPNVFRSRFASNAFVSEMFSNFRDDCSHLK